ncbi:class I SAM-dependent methyltransferase [Aciditerrimonas ferrireducens]|uniref:class I SAM-dependent methyltransferase n=1 Tax=Aciditerrimonas ferrireducens TaxID=667306 RepID=UPI0020061004|nr:class I SAM-dependent methyltransferase [Aciditerrimonas ferrireducens]MCK4176258.1 class I SAM-dependent methyltransferase [Aciditerrimonas ferrireducens]
MTAGPCDHPTCPPRLALARATKGFMPEPEGLALHALAHEVGRRFPGATLLEVGAWCGKSTLYLGAAAAAEGALLYSLDHHRGSEENQAGWEHHDPEVLDPRTGRIDTLPFWRRAVADADLEGAVVGLVGDSPTVAAHFAQPLHFCFIDGGHGEAPAWADYRGWAPKVVPGGVLAIHDVFPDPADGGRPPYELWCDAVASGDWSELGTWGSLRALERR